MERFPDKWTKLEPGDKVLADAQAAADQVLAPTAAPASAHGGESAPEEPEFESPFNSATDYVVKEVGYDIGGDNELFTIGKHKFYFRHSPHWAVVQVQPALKQEAPPGQVVKPVADPSQPVTTVIMLRDLGSLRVPPAMVALASGVIFGICCFVLHQRDREIMQAKATAASVSST